MRLRYVICLAAMTGLMAGLSLRSAQALNLLSEDKAFIDEAAQSGNAEIEAAQIALERSENPKVHEFAQMMLDQHKAMAQELNILAQGRDMELPTGPGLIQKGKLALLKSDEGTKFDTEYAQKYGVQAHEETVELFENYLKRGKDQEVLAFAQKSLPVIKQHLQHGSELYDSIKAPRP